MQTAKKAIKSLKFFRRVAMKLPHSVSEYKINTREFGKEVAKQVFFHSINEKPYSINFKRTMLQYMESELKDITDKYNGFAEQIITESPHKNSGKNYIWTCWWQGEAQMPPIVKACINRMRNVFSESNAELIVITQDNVNDYIELPDYLFHKLSNGSICYAHFADIIRWGLVAKYGGGWFDACDYLCKNNYEYYNDRLNRFFFTAKFTSPDKVPNEPSQGKWANQYFFAQQGCIVTNYVYESLLYYWKKHNKAFDYIFLDYIILCAYNNIDQCRVLIDSVPPNSENFYEFRWKMNDPYVEEVYNHFMTLSDFYNISYKMNLIPYTCDHQLTFYGHILKENNVL